MFFTKNKEKMFKEQIEEEIYNRFFLQLRKEQDEKLEALRQEIYTYIKENSLSNRIIDTTNKASKEISDATANTIKKLKNKIVKKKEN